jgi:hypothetical protein
MEGKGGVLVEEIALEGLFMSASHSLPFHWKFTFTIRCSVAVHEIRNATTGMVPSNGAE